MNRARSKLSPAEIERRREAVEHATANARLEGQFPSAESEAIIDAFIQGEVEFDELMTQLKAQHTVRQRATWWSDCRNRFDIRS